MLGVFSTILLAFAPAYAVAASCAAGFNWTYNSEGQSPCDIASALYGVCTPGAGPLPPLPPGSYYLGPTVEYQNECTCSSVYFSMMCACAVCQSRDTLQWTAYTINCTTVYKQTFPDALPAGLHVPHYAYLDVTAVDGFDATLAQAAGGAESVGIPSATSTGPAQSSGKKSDAAAIAGGVVGGLAVLGIAVGVVVWLLGRRNGPASTLQPQSPTSDGSSLKPSIQQQIYHPYTNTFPASQPPPGIFQSSSNPQQSFVTYNYAGHPVPQV